MYGQHFQQSMDQRSEVANPARGQLIRQKSFSFFFPCPRSRLRIWSRETGSAVSSRTLVLYTRDSSRFPRRRPYTPSTATESVPSLSGQAIAYRWRSLPRVHRHRVRSPQGSSSIQRTRFYRQLLGAGTKLLVKASSKKRQ